MKSHSLFHAAFVLIGQAQTATLFTITMANMTITTIAHHYLLRGFNSDPWIQFDSIRFHSIPCNPILHFRRRFLLSFPQIDRRMRKEKQEKQNVYIMFK